MPENIPTAAAWNWDTYLEGSHILIEPGEAPRVWTFTANAAITAGDGLELTTGSVVQLITDASQTGIGVADVTRASGAHVPVIIEGLVRGVTASGTVAAGRRVEGAGSGRFKQLIAASDSDVQMGVAITTATNGNTFILYVDAS